MSQLNVRTFPSVSTAFKNSVFYLSFTFAKTNHDNYNSN